MHYALGIEEGADDVLLKSNTLDLRDMAEALSRMIGINCCPPRPGTYRMVVVEILEDSILFEKANGITLIVKRRAIEPKERTRKKVLQFLATP